MAPPAGLESRFRNKSSYLRFSCESRIRSYLREVGPLLGSVPGGLQTGLPDQGAGHHAAALSRVLGVPQVSAHASVVGEPAREEFVRVVDAMGQKLRTARYNGCYFDRGAKAGSRLCTPEGWFSCQVGCMSGTLGPQRLPSCLQGAGWDGGGPLPLPGSLLGPKDLCFWHVSRCTPAAWGPHCCRGWEDTGA